MNRWRQRVRDLRLAARINFGRLEHRESVRLIARTVRRGLTGRRTPLWLMIGMTARCQCACVHCASYVPTPPDGGAPAGELTGDEIRDIIDQAAGLGVIKIVLFGGEPMLHEEIEPVVRHARQHGLIVSINSNGVALDRDRVARLAAAGLTELQISLDAATADRHDRLRRRRGTFERACAAVGHATEAGIPAVVSTYASPASVDSGELERTVRLGLELGATAVRIVQPIASGRWLRRLDCLLDPLQEAVVKRLLSLDRVYGDDQKDAYRICAALVRDFCHVTPQGEVLPCCYVPISFGSVRNEPLARIWHRMINHPMYRLPKRNCPMNREDFRSRYIDGVPLESRNPFPIEDLP